MMIFHYNVKKNKGIALLPIYIMYTCTITDLLWTGIGNKLTVTSKLLDTNKKN